MKRRELKGIPSLRTLTKKSKLGFGKFKDVTIGNLLERRKHAHLISVYYKLTSINFNEEVLKELKIINNYVLKKPGCNKDLYYQFLNDQGYQKPIRGIGADILKRNTKPFSKGKLQSINHGF